MHIWGNSVPTLDCIGQWGNNKTIDDWTYVPLNAIQTLAVPGLESHVHYRKTVSPAVTSITPGQTFTYTVTAENTGDLPLTGLSFTDDLTNVLDDATYNTDVSATSGSASFSSPNISWSGDLAIGQTATITYSVTMNDPVTGDGQLRNGVVGTGPNSNCTGTTPIDPDCLTLTPLPDISSEKTLVSPSTPQAGDTVNYEFTVTNNGAAAINDLAIADDLGGVLDDATYNDDAAASSGTVAFNPATRRIVWNGDLAATGNAGDSATITLTVTINSADNLGDAMLNNALVSSDCPNPAIFDSGDPGYVATCVTSTPVSAWLARKTMASATSINPGSGVTYTVEIENTGATDLTGLNVNDDLTDILDDATYSGSESTTIGTVNYAAPTLTWSGDLNAGQTAMLTYGVTVNGQENLGNRNLVNTIAGSMNCPSTPITDPNDPNYNADCVVAAQVVIPDSSSSEDGLANTGQPIMAAIVCAFTLICAGIAILIKGPITLGKK